uniref:Heterochromatin protein 1 n=1 Tax=Xenopsylla cheopis TaxID=163159 RepID=A0A6M2DRP7_XENCH
MAKKKGKKNDESEEEYTVEKVLDKRVRNGKTEYYLKWIGYDDSDNTWEPVEHLDCPELIQAYENAQKMKKDEDDTEKEQPSTGRKRKQVDDKKSKDSDKKEPAEKKKKDTENLVGFSRGLDPDKILGASDSSGQLMFLIKWKGCEEADLVPAKQANVRCPQHVIAFYEERLTWHSPDDAN